MALTKVEFPPENKISPAGWTMPADILGFDPEPRPEPGEDCLGTWDTFWQASIPQWIGERFAMPIDGKWTTGQADLFGGYTAPEGSWPRRVFMGADGSVIDVKPWPTRPNNAKVNIPTPVAAPDAPNANSNIKNGPKSLGEAARTNHGNRTNWPTPKASGQEDPDTLIERKGVEAAEKHNLTAAVKMSVDPKYKADAVGKLPTPKANGNRNSRAAIMGGSDKHPSKSDLALEQAVECLEGDLPREVDSADELPKRFQTLFPTPTSTEKAGHNPQTGKGGGLARHVKDELGLIPTPRAGKTSSENEETWKKRRDAGNVTTPPLGLAAQMMPPTVDGEIGWAGRPDGRTNWPTPRSSEHKGVGPIGSKSHKHMLEKRYLCATVQEAELGGDEPVYPTPRGGSGGVGMCGGTGAREKLQGLKDEGVISEEERKSMQNGRGGQLNPDWVEPLMGYRIGTTRIEPEIEAWFKLDQKRLKATDLKKIHEAEMTEEDED